MLVAKDNYVQAKEREGAALRRNRDGLSKPCRRGVGTVFYEWCLMHLSPGPNDGESHLQRLLVVEARIDV